MSRNAKISDNTIPDAHKKLSGVTEEEKISQFECSTSDSGFLSSGNLLSSGEIFSEEIQPERKSPTVDSGVIDVNLKTPEIACDTSMKLDSGVDLALSQSFSSLNLDTKDLNDLNSSTYHPSISSTTDLKISNVPEKQQWELYYEQDENGDT